MRKTQLKDFPIKQHYVPQFYLRKFGCEDINDKKKCKIIVMDKESREEYKRKIIKVAKKDYYYTVKFDVNCLTDFGKKIFSEDNYCVFEREGEVVASIENWLGDLENRVAPAYKRLLFDPKGCTFSDKCDISVLIALLRLRTPKSEQEFNRCLKIDSSVKRRKKMMKKYFRKYPDDSILKNLLWLKGFTSLIKCEAEKLISRQWKIMRVDMAGRKFVTSDNPVQSYHPSIPGAIGWMLPGVNIVFPLSPYVALLINFKTCNGPIDVETISDDDVEMLNELQESNALKYIYKSV